MIWYHDGVCKSSVYIYIHISNMWDNHIKYIYIYIYGKKIEHNWASTRWFMTCIDGEKTTGCDSTFFLHQPTAIFI